MAEWARLRASEPGEPLSFSTVYPWLDDLLARRRIRPILGDTIDGSDWVYLWVETGSGERLVKTDDCIVRTDDGTIGVVSSELYGKVF